jgi:hypothetical protein
VGLVDLVAAIGGVEVRSAGFVDFRPVDWKCCK